MMSRTNAGFFSTSLVAAPIVALVLLLSSTHASAAITSYLTIANSGSGLPSNEFVYATVTVTALGSVQYEAGQGYYYESVRFEVDPIDSNQDPDSPLNADSNFGVKTFVFNYEGNASSVTLSDFDPDSWNVQKGTKGDPNISEFGIFELIAESPKGNETADPLGFTATTVDRFYAADALAAAEAIELAFKTNYEDHVGKVTKAKKEPGEDEDEPATPSGQGTSYNYAVHIISFNTSINDQTSAWFADGNLPPTGAPGVLPEPASLVLWGVGLGLMGFGARRRMRKA